MKNFFITFFIFTIAIFAFAKTSIAAVPTAAKSRGIEHTKDSLLLSAVEPKNQEDVEKEIDELLKNARKLTNAAFCCIAVFGIGLLSATYELYTLAQILAFGAPLLGLILSVISIVKVINVRRLLDYFPDFERDEQLMNRFSVAITNAVIAGILFSLGSLILGGFAFTDGEIFSSLPSVTATAGLGFILFSVLDALSFKTKNKVKK
jgi:hypothetical protein